MCSASLADTLQRQGCKSYEVACRKYAGGRVYREIPETQSLSSLYLCSSEAAHLMFMDRSQGSQPPGSLRLIRLG